MNKKKPNIRALNSLIDEVGGQVKLAQLLTKAGYPIGQSAIALWISRGAVSKRFALHIEEVFGHPTRYELCPEHYGTASEKISRARLFSGQRVGKHRQGAS